MLREGVRKKREGRGKAGEMEGGRNEEERREKVMEGRSS